MNRLVWYYCTSKVNSRLVKWNLSSILSHRSVVSVSVDDGSVKGHEFAWKWLRLRFFFFYIVQMKPMLPGFIHVFEWSFFYYYCKYRNCNPVIKWNMTDFLQQKPLFLQCPFSGWLLGPIHFYTLLQGSQSCFIENLFSRQFSSFPFQ